MRRVRRQVGRLAAHRPRPRPAGRHRSSAARRARTVRRRRGLRGGARRRAGQHDRLLPAARRPSRATSARSPLPTRAATCSRWADGWSSRSTSPRSPSTSRARRSSAIFDAAAAVVAEAGGTIAGGHTIRNPEPIFGLAVQGVVAPATGCSARVAPGPATCCVLSASRSAPALALAGGSRRRQGGGDRGHARAQPRRRGGAAARSAPPCTRSPTSPATAWPATAGRWPSAAACGSSSTPPAIRRLSGRPRGGRARRAHRWRSAQPRVRRRATSTVDRRCSDGEALCMDPQTSGGLLAAVDPAVARRR